MDYSHYHFIKEFNYTVPHTAETNTKHDFVWLPLHHCKTGGSYIGVDEDPSLPEYDCV
jgi:hypothetical protein